jgi:MFS family permease
MLGVGGSFCEWDDFDGGWPSMFYIGGASCLLLSLLWSFTVYDSPAEHPRITGKERTYIESNMASKSSKVIISILLHVFLVLSTEFQLFTFGLPQHSADSMPLIIFPLKSQIYKFYERKDIAVS